MTKVINNIYKFEEFVSKIFLLFIIVLVFFAAVVRWIGYPIAWSIDVAQLLFGWVVFFGADIALKNNNHIGIEIILLKFPKKIQKAIKLTHYFLIAGFLILISIYGIHLTIANRERLFNTIQVSYSFATASVPIGCILMFITTIGKVRELLKNKDRKTEISVN